MAAIPLLCNICPQEPDFSDLSHLLTHVSSKGHLSHYLKAQLRGRVDDDVRAKIDAYDDWYRHYQIEHLLSQRMSVKALKGRLHKARKAPVKTRRPARLRGKSDNTSPSLQPWVSPTKTEDAIDPQLSDRLDNPVCGSDQGTQHCQRDDNLAPNLSHSGPYQGHFEDVDEGIDLLGHSDINEPLRRAVNHTERQADPLEGPVYQTSRDVYPDPSTLSLFKSASQSPPPVAEFHTGRQRHRRISRAKHDIEPDSVIAETNASPILKGIKWPGMSLFDSADLDAQRLRNQKKDGTVLEQMQQNSIFVEQMEDIFWPDGTLKKRRLITGNVDSSPTSQPSPPPKRRRKTQQPRKALADLSTNGPLVRRRGKNREEAQLLGHTPETLHHSQNVSAYQADISETQPFDHDSEIKIKQSMTGIPVRHPPQRSFKVFKDSRPESSGDLHGVTNPRRIKTDHQSVPPQTEIPSSLDAACRLLFSPIGDKPASQNKKSPMNLPIPLSQENEESHLPSHGIGSKSTSKPYAQAPRDTQRYFSATINEVPQFFSALPPHMDFFGMAAPTYRGATLNPLNPQFRHTRAAPEALHMPSSFSVSTNLLSTCMGRHLQPRFESKGSEIDLRLI